MTLLASAGCSRNAPQSSAGAAPPQPGIVRITQFYVWPAQPPAGEKAMLCYGVENASSVRLDPPVDRVWPAMSRCLEIVPARPVTYTLTAERDHDRVSQSLTVKPGPLQVKIIEVSINTLEVKRGERVTVCYKAKNAVSVTIRPGFWINPHGPDLGCVWHQPAASTTYTVVATGAGGAVDTEKVTARVK